MFFIEAKKTNLTLRDLGQLWSYCKLIDPEEAFLMTSVAFGGISMFAMTTKRDFSSMGKFLFIALIIMIVAGISNIFIQSSMMQLAIASVGALLFSAFILYDTQNIIKGQYDSPIEAARALYLDFFNLFISLLQILGIMNSGDKE